MALTVTTKSKVEFFEKLFGATNPLVTTANKMVNSGVTFDIQMFGVSATSQGSTYVVTLPKSTTAIMKGLLPEDEMKVIRHKVASFLMGVPYTSQPATEAAQPAPVVAPPTFTVVLTGYHPEKLLEVIKAIRNELVLSLKDAKAMVENSPVGTGVELLNTEKLNVAKVLMKVVAGAGGYVTLLENQKFVTKMPPLVTWGDTNLSSSSTQTEHTFGATPMTASVKSHEEEKPVNKVIPLREAKAIGQKVRGTSPGSVYHCVAVGERVRLAARIKSATSVSIRAEWTAPNPAEQDALEAIGMNMNGDYASIHLYTEDGVKPSKVIGAFVLGSGIDWQKVVLSEKDLVTD